MINKSVESLSELIDEVSKLQSNKDNVFVFRGEPKDYGDTALTPGIYRKEEYINNEEKIFREMQRFNDFEFKSDKTAFDKLSRMQHHGAPTRLLDLTDDLLSAVYFAVENRSSDDEKDNAFVYVFEIKEDEIHYYDSDTVSVISNLAKIPLKNDKNKKSKEVLIEDIKNKDVEEFNAMKSAKFLRHEIREEKPQFEPIIDPKHITSVLYVKPKLTSDRIKSQKGSFFLFGLHPEDPSKSINIKDTTLDTSNPIEKYHIFQIKKTKIDKIKKALETIGITKPFIYPELDKVAEHLK